MAEAEYSLRLELDAVIFTGDLSFWTNCQLEDVKVFKYFSARMFSPLLIFSQRLLVVAWENSALWICPSLHCIMGKIQFTLRQLLFTLMFFISGSPSSSAA